MALVWVGEVKRGSAQCSASSGPGGFLGFRSANSSLEKKEHRKGDNDNFCLYLWELWMHPVVLLPYQVEGLSISSGSGRVLQRASNCPTIPLGLGDCFSGYALGLPPGKSTL